MRSSSASCWTSLLLCRSLVSNRGATLLPGGAAASRWMRFSRRSSYAFCRTSLLLCRSLVSNGGAMLLPGGPPSPQPIEILCRSICSFPSVYPFASPNSWRPKLRRYW